MLSRIERWVRLNSVVPRYHVDEALYRLSGRARQLEQYKDCHRGRPMLVIGNGPSLNRTPLEDFMHVPSIGMNKINLLFERSAWRPDYIICLNNLVISQNRDFFETTGIRTLIAYKARWFLNWRRNPRLALFNIHASDAFSRDFPSGVGRGTSVSYAALQLAHYMGANPVIIFGIDHRFSSEGTTRLSVEKLHGSDPNHFDPRYFMGQKWGLPDLENDRRLFRLAREAFEADGREILDATIDGALTVFRKISLADARSLCRSTSIP